MLFSLEPWRFLLINPKHLLIEPLALKPVARFPMTSISLGLQSLPNPSLSMSLARGSSRVGRGTGGLWLAQVLCKGGEQLIEAHNPFSRWRTWPHHLQWGAAGSCCSWRGMFDFPSAQPILFWENTMDVTLTPKSLKILSDSWATKLFGSYCSWLPAVHSTTTREKEKFIYVGMSNFFCCCCYNSSLDLKAVHVINHIHFTALIRTGLNSFTVFCY